MTKENKEYTDNSIFDFELTKKMEEILDEMDDDSLSEGQKLQLEYELTKFLIQTTCYNIAYLKKKRPDIDFPNLKEEYNECIKLSEEAANNDIKDLH